MLKGDYRLKKNKDFKIVFQKGKSGPSRNTVIYFRKNNLGRTRVGFSVSKRLGGAVVRNRIKRVLRESIRKQYFRILPGVDLIFIARGPIKEIKSSQIEQSLVKLMEKHGLIRSSNGFSNDSAN